MDMNRRPRDDRAVVMPRNVCAGDWQFAMISGTNSSFPDQVIGRPRSGSFHLAQDYYKVMMRYGGNMLGVIEAKGCKSVSQVQHSQK